MKKLLKITRISSLFFFLTVLTQIGGIAYLVSLFISSKIKKEFRFKKTALFLATYLLFTFLIVPFIAPIFGREPLRNNKNISPTNYMTVILNRNYVRPEMNTLLGKTQEILKEKGIQIKYLDANFPFINGFPLIPHLSHNDGKKLDLSLIYETKTGKISNLKKSMSGYGDFEEPTYEEFNQIHKCKKEGYFQYDYPKYVTFGKINQELVFSEKGTKKLIDALLTNSSLGKLFIEPHLKQRLKLTDSRVRYHGCRAVRHDDHIHIQLK